MNELGSMIWIETHKSLRSRMPLWLAIGSLFMPLGIGFLLFAARNPELTRQLGLVSAKADLMAYAGTDWPAYLVMTGEIIATGGFFLTVLILSWMFGREFVDGTLKDLLAVPVWRGSILLAKFIVAAAWSALLALLLLASSLAIGVLLGLPGGTLEAILQGCLRVAVTALMTLWLVLPFALLASIGRGYLLPVGLAVLIVMLTNVAMVAGWGELFPWGIAGLYSQGKIALAPVSYGIVFLTGLAGMAATWAWWQSADQSR